MLPFIRWVFSRATFFLFSCKSRPHFGPSFLMCQFTFEHLWSRFWLIPCSYCAVNSCFVLRLIWAVGLWFWIRSIEIASVDPEESFCSTPNTGKTCKDFMMKDPWVLRIRVIDPFHLPTMSVSIQRGYLLIDQGPQHLIEKVGQFLLRQQMHIDQGHQWVDLGRQLQNVVDQYHPQTFVK